MITDLSEPLIAYNKELKDEFRNQTEIFFDELVKRAGTDVDANRQTVQEYKKAIGEIKDLQKKISLYNTLKVLCFFGIILLFVISSITIAITHSNDYWIGIVVSAVSLILLPVLIILIVRLIRKRVVLEVQLDDLMKQAEALLQTAWQQMASLNVLYDWNIPAQILAKTTDQFELDRFFDARKYEFLNSRYGLPGNEDESVSSIFVQSGTINKNPFLICKDLKQSWYNHTYHGYLTIHWTERVRTKNGYTTVNKSQTLHATVTKPAPRYDYVNYLVYGNDGAPNLTFSRAPSRADEMNKKQIEKKIKNDVKKLDKKAKDEIMDNDPTTNYQRFGNDEFESLFGGIDRDNEVEYRLLFTPLAQINMLKLLKEGKPFGDDFYFNKVKMLNYIQSEHSQNFNYKAEPGIFINFDHDDARRFFIEYNTKYFENLFFDLAPLLSIPLYQDSKPVEYIYKDIFKSNVSCYEHESIANTFDVRTLMHPETITNVILKTQLVDRINDADKLRVNAHSFKGIKHIEYIMMHGGDGRNHSVPVEWIEYVPLVQESYMLVQKKNSSRVEYMNELRNDSFMKYMGNYSRDSQYNYERGLFSFLLSRDVATEDVNELSRVYKGNGQSYNKPANDIRNMINDFINHIEGSVEEATKTSGGLNINRGGLNNSNSNVGNN